MKHSFALATFVAASVAQIDPAKLAFDQSAIEPVDQLAPEVQPFAVAVSTIQTSVIMLDNATTAFQGSSQVNSLNAAANAVLSTISTQSNVVAALPKLPEDEDLLSLLPLLPYVDVLADYVNITAFDIIQRKNLLVAACAGPLAFQQANNLNTSAASFVAVVKSKLPTAVVNVPDPDIAPIFVALNSAISVFADQTTLPATCSSTTISTTTSTTMTTMTTMTTTQTGGVYPTMTTTTTTTTTQSGGVYPTMTTTTTTTNSGAVYPTMTTSTSMSTSQTGSVYSTTTKGPKNCYRRRHRAAKEI